jgi:hypothetical protein
MTLKHLGEGGKGNGGFAAVSFSPLFPCQSISHVEWSEAKSRHLNVFVNRLYPGIKKYSSRA